MENGLPTFACCKYKGNESDEREDEKVESIKEDNKHVAGNNQGDYYGTFYKTKMKEFMPILNVRLETCKTKMQETSNRRDEDS